MSLLPTRVVAGIICDESGRVLIAQKPEDSSLPLLWEFPGGKVEKGESDQAALHRELKEELDIKVKVGSFVHSEQQAVNDEQEILLVAYECFFNQGKISLSHHIQFQWVSRNNLLDCKLGPLDRPIAEKYQSF